MSDDYSDMTECYIEEQFKKLPTKVYTAGSLMTFARGLHNPFLSAYLVDMGATLAQLGIFQSVGNIAPTILQPAWGVGCDRVGHAKAFVAFGTFTGFFTVFLFLFAASPLDMILLYAIQSVLLSIQIPTWLSLIGGLMGEKNRGDELGRLGMVSNISALLATLLSGFIAGFPAIIPEIRFWMGDIGTILIPPVETWREAYYFPFYSTAIIGIIASLVSLSIKESSNGKKDRRLPKIQRIFSKSGEFRRLCFVATFFSFAMSWAWPFFVIVQRVWLQFTLLEIALTSVIHVGSTILFTYHFGRLSDRIGRKPVIVCGRLMLFLVPLLHAFAFNKLMVFAANAIGGVSAAASVNAHTAYIYDIAPSEERGSFMAVFNAFTGIVFLLGSLIAGLMGEFLVPYVGSISAVFIMLIVSSILRFIGSFVYLLLREPREYSSNMWEEIRYMFGKNRPRPQRI